MNGLAIYAGEVRVPTWRDLVSAMATVMSYGGKGITTNRLHGSGTEPVNGGWGTGAGTHATTDTALFNPASEARVAGTSSLVTTTATVPNDTYQNVTTIQAAGSRAITEYGLFDTATAAPATTLAATVASSGATSITVASGTGFTNTTGYAQIEQEVVNITAGGGTATWTVTRGARGSTAATHPNAAAVIGGEGNAGGNMYAVGDFSVINLNTGDSIQFTFKVQYT